MINFKPINAQTFLNEYWQKKPFVFRNALPDFNHPISADELAGLSLEDDVESRLVIETLNKAPFWQVKTGPFAEKEFTTLPKTNWTLLVQGVDRIVPDVAALLNHFNFIPQWRVDDVMISYAVNQGSVGPHYDNYDVFLYQAVGTRKWTLTTRDCNLDNYLTDVPLRIMNTFVVEEEYILEPGDMLYLPPHVGHHGVSLSDDCMTYSFGYRSYQAQEMWNSFGDYISEQNITALYKDPTWTASNPPALIPNEAYLNARELMQQMLNDDGLMKTWFGCFATSLDMQAEQHLPEPIPEEDVGKLDDFIEELHSTNGLMHNASCRFAYHTDDLTLFINGCIWDTNGVLQQLIEYTANEQHLPIETLRPFLEQHDNQLFLYELWKLQWLQFID